MKHYTKLVIYLISIITMITLCGYVNGWMKVNGQSDGYEEIFAIATHTTQPVVAIAGRLTSIGESALVVENLDTGTQTIVDSGIRPRSVSWSPDNTKIVSSVNTGLKSEYRVYDANNFQLLSSVEHGALLDFGVSWSQDSTMIAAPTVIGNSSTAGFSIVDVLSGEIVSTFETDPTLYGRVLAVGWGVDGVYVLYESSQIGIWDISQGVQTEVLVISDIANPLRISPDRNLIAVASYSTNIYIINTNTNQLINTLQTADPVSAIEWSSDSMQLVSFSSGLNGGTITVWNTSDGTRVFDESVNTFIRTDSLSWLGEEIVYGTSETGQITLRSITNVTTNLILTSICSPSSDVTRVWRVRNTNPDPVDFTWDVVGTDQTGSGTVPNGSEENPGEITFETTAVAASDTVAISVDGTVQDTVSSVIC